MKKTRGLNETLADTAFRKRRVAEVRFTGQSSQHEPPRSVYLASCAEIARAFEPDGFKYAKSKQALTRKVGPLRFGISFQSSHNNVAGEYVALWIHTGTYSTELQQWRKDNNATYTGDYFAGGQIGNLVQEKSWYEWNLADPKSRGIETADAIDTVRRIALPMFRVFEVPKQAADALLVRDQPGLEVNQAIDFALCFGSRAHAEVVIDRFLTQRADLRADYLKLLRVNRPAGRNATIPGGWSAQLAEATLRFDLHPATSEA